IKKFELYSSKALQEKLFLHTDKDFYVAGEILWFKIYYADGGSHKPLDLSKVAYVEILNGVGKAELQAKISLEPGQSKGSFYLPVTLNSGNYIIRAYTNWMKNFDAGYFFEKKITIVNTLKNPESPVHKDSTGIAIDFFPEGGSLVYDVQSKIGFRVTDSKGKGVDFSGFVINEAGDTVTRFSPFKFGIGNFLLKPISSHSYKTVILLTDGTIINKSLPEVYSYGYVMNLYDKGDGDLRVAVYRKKLPGEQNAEQVLLAAHTRQSLHVAEQKIIDNNDSTIFLVAKTKIGQGITHFTLFNGNGKPVCERLFFIKPTASVTLNVKGEQELYTTRHKVNLSVSAQYGQQGKTPLNLSASVFGLDTLQETDQPDIVNYMWLISDLKGGVESPGFYFSNNAGVDIAADNLMLTQGWRRFRWNDILNEQTAFIKFLPEYNGQLINGIIKNTRNGKLVNDLNAFLSVPGHPFGFYVSTSNPDGLVQFEVKNYYGNGEIITRTATQKDSSYKVEILSPFIEPDAGRKYPAYVLQPETKEQLQRRSINMQVQNIYSGDTLKKFSAPFITDTLPFFGYPEVTYKLDDYKRFTTMEEVLREYVREINVGVKNGKLTLKMFSPLYHIFYDGDMLVLLDGVFLSDADKILTYDPLKVKRLDIIQSQYVLGSSIFNGVASFSTYEGVFDKFELDPKLVAIDYDGLQLQREFYSPVYETKEQLEKRIPDFRNTLLWSPDITTGPDGKTMIQFYTSDRPGKYMVVLQGMSANGDLVSTHTIFEVK
ncbi:MAG: hypothetical protein M3O67_01775, partial [Bacteroidota bacterium]|nr:hypothetical protein [Bacteroidota bacterium]